MLRYVPNATVTHSTLSVCKTSVTAVMSGDPIVFKRITSYIRIRCVFHRFGYSIYPLEFLYRQLFFRLIVMSPEFVRVFSIAFSKK